MFVSCFKLYALIDQCLIVYDLLFYYTNLDHTYFTMQLKLKPTSMSYNRNSEFQLTIEIVKSKFLTNFRLKVVFLLKLVSYLLS